MIASVEHSRAEKKFWPNYKEAVRRNFRKLPLEQYSVCSDSESLTVELDSCKTLRGMIETWKIPWMAISSVLAMKIDLVTYDEVYLTIFVGEDPRAEDALTILPESAAGWAEVVKVFPRYLKGCLPFEGWFPNVAHPPFEENAIVIYEKVAT